MPFDLHEDSCTSPQQDLSELHERRVPDRLEDVAADTHDLSHLAFVVRVHLPAPGR
jgi:hypothetical protein